LLIAALFWRGSTKWGALAATLWIAFAVGGIAVFQAVVPPAATGTLNVVWSIGGLPLLARTPASTSVLGFMPVVPMTVISALLMWIVSLVTPKPGSATIQRYFLNRS
jgi:hypothetical protein